MCHGPESGNPELMCFLDLFIFLMAGVCVLCWCPCVPAAGVRVGVSGRPVYKHHQARRVCPSRWLATPKDDDTHFQLISLIGGSYLAVWLSFPASQSECKLVAVRVFVRLPLWFISGGLRKWEGSEHGVNGHQGEDTARESGNKGIYCCCI